MALVAIMEPPTAISESERVMRLERIRDRRRVNGRRIVRITSISVEPLEGRALLTMPGYSMPMPPPVMMPTNPAPVTTPAHPAPAHPATPLTPRPGNGPSAHANHRQHHASGLVTKVPHFYRFYTGPRWAELNAMKASVKLAPNGDFTFTGTNKGVINKAPAVYVWGLDRSGKLSAGPFTGLPNVRFDAVVVVSLNSSLTPMVKVVDLARGITTGLPSSSASIHGRTVTVRIPGSLLPSTGLAPAQFRFNFWPEDGGPGSAGVASFLPGNSTALVGSS
jgi:hypothetical protein